VAAYSPAGEEMARAAPFPIFIGKDMGVVITPKIHLEISESNSIFLLRITLGFFNLSD
jgi:hypothetical protein